MAAVDAASPAVGDRGPARTFGPLSRIDLVRYAEASGAVDPIHDGDDAAPAVGFATVVAKGMFPAGLLGTYATDWFGTDTIRRFAVRFREQVEPDDVLTCTGIVTAVTPIADTVRIDVDLSCVRQTGGVAIDGGATFLLEVW